MFMSVGVKDIDGGPDTGEASSSSKQSIELFRNFILFCLFYGIAHGCVDSVLAYSSAELGITIGSYAGFSLFITYAFSCLLMAKPALRLFDAKRTVMVGLTGILIYVGAFFVAVAVDQVDLQAAAAIFISGAALSGLASGILWTGQSSYYNINAKRYAASSGANPSHVINDFAAIFAMFYLSSETGFKLLATMVFYIDSQATNSSHESWQFVVFAIYAISALVAFAAFALTTMSFKDEKLITNQYEVFCTPPKEADTPVSKTTFSPLLSTSISSSSSLSEDTVESNSNTSMNDKNDSNSESASIAKSGEKAAATAADAESKITWEYLLEDAKAVCRAVYNVRLLQLLIPFQVCCVSLCMCVCVCFCHTK
jgi:hypothetical protein